MADAIVLTIIILGISAGFVVPYFLIEKVPFLRDPLLKLAKKMF